MFSEAQLQHPILNHDQEIALARRIQSGDAAALDELVRHNLRLVYQIARRFYTTDPGTTFDDLIQEGLLGLLTAARKYDPDRGTKFSTYATYWIRQGVQRCALTAGTIRRSADPNHRQVRAASIRAHALRQAPIIRLDAPLRDRRGDDSDSTLMDILADESPSVEDQVLSNIEAERIFAALNLNERGQAIVRDWLSGLTSAEAERKHGVSRSWLYVTLHKRNQEKIMPRGRTATTTCLVPGCDQPLYVNSRGATLPRCHEHQKQFWRETSRAREAAMRNPDAAPAKPRIRPYTPPTAPPPPLPPRQSEASRLRDEGEGAGGEGFTGQSQEQPHDCTCPDCIYREIVSLLAARNPRIAELVEVMQTERRLRDDLGI